MNQESRPLESEAANEATQKEPPFQDLARAATIWWWGTLLWLAPLYIGISGWGQWVLNAVGTALIALSFGLALQCLSDLWKNQGFSFFGTGMFVLTFAVVFHFIADFLSIAPVWATLARITALCLDAVGVPMLFLGVPYLLWSPRDQVALEETEQEAAERRTERRRETIVTALSLLTAFLPIFTSAVKAIYVFVIGQ